MIRTMPVLLSCLLALTGCFLTDSEITQRENATSGTGDGDDGNTDDGDDGDDGDRDDCKIEDQDIGAEVSVDLGTRTVTFSDWVTKDGEPGEYVGFTITVEGGDSVSYKVKAGGEVFASSDLVWIHPNGTSGPDASGISNVDMCDDDDGDDGTDDGTDDGDGGDGTDDGGDGTDDDGGDIIVD